MRRSSGGGGAEVSELARRRSELRRAEEEGGRASPRSGPPKVSASLSSPRPPPGRPPWNASSQLRASLSPRPSKQDGASPKQRASRPAPPSRDSPAKRQPSLEGGFRVLHAQPAPRRPNGLRDASYAAPASGAEEGADAGGLPTPTKCTTPRGLGAQPQPPPCGSPIHGLASSGAARSASGKSVRCRARLSGADSKALLERSSELRMSFCSLGDGGGEEAPREWRSPATTPVCRPRASRDQPLEAEQQEQAPPRPAAVAELSKSRSEAYYAWLDSMEAVQRAA
eukprot:jgi/Tetstr1/422358/TSEL_013199.t1